MRDRLIDVFTHLDEHISYKEEYGILFDTPFVKAVEDVLQMLKGATVQELDGCEYCKADNDGFRRMFGAFSLVNPFHGKGWQIHAGKCKPREIHYCPMCGRKLSEPPKGE